MPIPSDIQSRVDSWLQPPYDSETQRAVAELVQHDQAALLDAFGSMISFGTGGMRGIMGVGTSRLNRYTIGSATQGLAHYLLTQTTKPSVFISYDSRKNSAFFAQETACVLAGNGIRSFLTPELRPTPFVSFGCRYHRCTAAVMITASHNPPEYNGYKVYWSDGAQVVPPHDQGIMREVAKVTSPDQVSRAPADSPLITPAQADIDEAYYQAMLPLQNFPTDNRTAGHQLKIVYSPLHGAGITTLPKGLQRWGFSSVSLVKAQAIPDPLFPAALSPNPENPKTLQLGIDQLMTEKADLFLASDPDADRIAAVIRNNDEPIILNGNQIAAICLYFLCSTLTEAGTMPQNGAFVSTIVTTELLQAIAAAFHKPCLQVLTGFKYIGEKIRTWENDPEGYQFIFGAEESLGYLYGSQVRDKDATISACLIAEIALQQKKQGKTLLDLLNLLYRRFGLFKEKQLSIPLGQAEMKQVATYMTYLRAHLPKEIAGEPVISTQDYLTQKEISSKEHKEKAFDLPQSDVVAFRLESGSKYVIRPSGTEPKIKLYGMIRKKNTDSIQEGLKDCDRQLDRQLHWLRDHYFS
ncbi:MAG: phospho-sugar mutase [Chlamydiota bacterium]